MSVFLGSNQVGSINLIQFQSINTDLEDALINRTISSYNNKTLNIRQYAFASCSNLTSVNFPSCSYIGDYAFASCSNLTSVNFPSCSYIGSDAFYDCTSLTSVNFPSCSYIGSYAFRNCSNLTLVSFSNCSYIGSSAFQNCSNLTSISFPSCNYIGSSAFDGCRNLISANFPNCSYIGLYAFYSCRNLTLVSFSNCSYIGNYAFYSCYNLLSLYLVGSSIPSLNNISAFTYTPISNYTTSTGGVYGSIYVPASLYNDYLTATNWSVYSSRIVGTYTATAVASTWDTYRNYVNFSNSSPITTDVIKITLNGTQYTCSKQDTTSSHSGWYYVYVYGTEYGASDWSEEFPFQYYCALESADGTPTNYATVKPSIFPAGSQITITVEEYNTV